MWPFQGKKAPRRFDVNSLPETAERRFWEMQCKFGFTSIRPQEKAIVAYVLYSVTQNDGVQDARLLVASDDGGFIVEAITPTSKGDQIEEGDLVLWLPMRNVPEAAKMIDMDDPRSGWMGLIMAKIAPDIQSSGQFKILCKFH
jgi:hypothetical protein